MDLYERRFNIDSFIEKCKEKDWIDIVIFAEKEYNNSMNELKNVDPYVNEMRIRYNRFVHEFLFYIRNGMKPLGSSDEEFRKMQIVADKLIEKGQWTKSE